METVHMARDDSDADEGEGGALFVAQDDSSMQAASVRAWSIEQLIGAVGTGRFQTRLILLTWLVWVVSGWGTSAGPFMLDAAEVHPRFLLTIEDRSGMLFGAGVAGIFGNILLGSFSDVHGRVRTILLALIVVTLSFVGMAVAPNKTVLIGMFVLSPVARDGFAGVAQNQISEWLSPAARDRAIVLLHAVWNVGRFIMTLLWILVPPTQHWTAYLLVGAFLPFSVALLMCTVGSRFESPRFFAVSGRPAECVQQCRAAAAVNNRVWPVGVDDTSVLLHTEGGKLRERFGRLRGQSEAPAAAGATSSNKSTAGGLRTLYQEGVRVRRAIVLITAVYACQFFVAGGIFFWLIEYLELVGAKAAVKPCFLVAPIGKLLAVFVLWVGGDRAILKRFERVDLAAMGFFLMAVSVSLLCFTKDTVALCAIVFAFQFAEEMVWATIAVLMIEAFPTAIRGTAVGVCFAGGHVGSILSTTLSGELMKRSPYLPIICYVVAAFLGCAICCFIDIERSGATLTDTAIESENEVEPVRRSESDIQALEETKAWM